MQSRGALGLGVVLIITGLLALISNLTGIDFSSICFPVGLILLGLLVMVRPKTVAGDTLVRFHLIGDIKRDGMWLLTPAEFWCGIGDVELDFSRADVPPGETPVRIYLLIGDVRLRNGAGQGLALKTTGLLHSVQWLGTKQDHFLNSVQFTTANYGQSERKIRVEVTTLIGDIQVIQADGLG